MAEPSIVQAAVEDYAALCALLRSAGLPTEDLRPQQTSQFLVAREGTQLLGCVAVEPCAAGIALLRSLAVAEGARHRGLGSAFVHAAEQQARRKDLQNLYLLTTTAQAWFERLGYMLTPRSDAPAAILAHPQSAGLCPASAALMSKTLVSAV